MLELVQGFVEEQELIRPGDRVIAGISGGADSVCLLFVLRALSERLNYSLSAVHVNHGLRGEESDEDEAFVRKLCEEQGVPLVVRRFEVAKRAAAKGLTLEEAGRQCRYEAFEQEAARLGGARIAVAHHKNDQAETVLLNLFRGTGIRGLRGMEAIQGNVIRPLLCLSRREIEQWLTENVLAWRTDSSNLSSIFTRNCIRHRILQEAEQSVNARAVEHICQSAGELAAIERYLERQTRKAAAGCLRETEEGCFLLEKEFRSVDPVIGERLMRTCLERTGGLKDVKRVHIRLLMELLDHQVGRSLNLPDGRRAVREYGGICFGRKEPVSLLPGQNVFYPKIPGSLLIEGKTWQFELLFAKKNQIIPRKAYTKWFDYDKIMQYTEIRTRRPGDYLEINRERERKTLKRYFTDEKIPAREREKLYLLADGSHIIWIPGYRISEGYKVTESTTRILSVHIDGGNDNE